MATLTLTRQLDCTPERAWQAFTESNELAHWWWPQWSDTSYTIDRTHRVDTIGQGSYRITTKKVGVGVQGTVLGCQQPWTLTVTWDWLDDGESSGTPDTVRISFAATGGHTDVVIEHESLDDIPDGIEQGWSDVLDRLVPHVAR